jgi:YD repeat-containing protein
MKQFLPFLIITAICLISFTLTALSQTTVSYIYDAAGRRIERVILLKSAKPDLADTTNSQKKKEVFEESVGNQKVLIYPNPTHGELKVEIQGFKQDTKTTVYLYSLIGKLLQIQNPTTSTFSLDLSNNAVGTYILKIVLGDKVSEWKIIKE